ncbi:MULTISPECIES: FtsW/RodA/SpoVE family cell cycle protein [unclassified Faecalibacterium]|uniref:FtsW/RodA/SpoVE family cell cycle protein n=1 Tax=unclassified Faecalibacterium TaxID=2646395 RepID=UPI000B371ED3|nr:MULTISPECIES: FtsW/RodA/SpoVE family cell cycle protein [unclassified Faecalibacterium]OUP30017.1 stage V sporulation protein E [Faecalibacterium sp. An192]OUQ37022.1 stage V sporulation protein E [Faecalibacterium sp. An122]
MAVARRRRPDPNGPVVVFQRNPGPWTPLTIGWLATLILIVIFGLVMLFSASYTTGYLRMGDSFYYIKSQTLYAAIGMGVMFLFSYIDLRFIRKFVWAGYIVSLILLVLVLFCEPLNGCRRWINIRGLPTLQASELVKFEMILLTAHLASRTPHLVLQGEPGARRVAKNFGRWLYQKVVRELMVPLIPLLPIIVLLALEPHMSGIVLMCAIVGSILLLNGSGGIITYGGAAAAILLLESILSHIDSIPYLQARLDGWTQDLTKMTDQTLQSLYAIGSGGLTGLGLGNSVEKQLWLPECTNDFIFSVVCEELGFVGAVVVILLFVLLLVQGFWIAFQAADRFSTLVGVGIMAQVGWQVFCNVAVVTNTLPNTGISLPFFSSGGTSLLLLMAEMGVMIHIGRNGARAAEARRAAQMEKIRQESARPPIVLNGLGRRSAGHQPGL